MSACNELVITPEFVTNIIAVDLADETTFTTADKAKLNGIEAGAQVNTVTRVAGKTGVVELNAGDIAYDASETYASGKIGAALKSAEEKLDTIEEGAEVNAVNSVNSKSGDVVLNAGDIGYDGSTDYNTGTVGNELTHLNRQISDVESQISEIPVTLNWQNGAILSSDGSIVASNSYKYTDAIPVSSGDGFSYTGSASTSIYMIAFYANETDTTALSTSKRGVLSEVLMNYKSIVPDGVNFVRLCCSNTTYLQAEFSVFDVDNVRYLADAAKATAENKPLGGYIHPAKPVISFMFDGEYDLNESCYNAMKAHNYNGSFSLQYDTNFPNNGILNYLIWQSNGFEIAAHSSVAVGTQSSATDEEIEQIIKDSYNVLTSYGFNIKTFVALAGNTRNSVISTVQKYFECGFTQINHKENENPIITALDVTPYKMWRYSLETSTLEQKKAAVDKCISTNSLLVFYTHARSNNQLFSVEDLNTLLDYIESKNVTVLPAFKAVAEYYAAYDYLKDKADVIIDSASGSSVTFTDGANNLPLKELTLYFSATQSGSGTPSPTNIREINGVSDCVVTQSGSNQSNSKSITVSWADDVGVSYGGYITLYDNRIATLTATHAIIDLGSINWTYAASFAGHHALYADLPSMRHQVNVFSAMCSHYPCVTGAVFNDKTCLVNSSGITSAKATVAIIDDDYSSKDAFKQALIGVEFVYELATPVSYTVYGNDTIYTYLGDNTIQSNTGNVTVKYRADTKLYIEQLTKPTEDDMTADHAISAGTFFMIGNSLYIATSQIAAGGAITPGTNATQLSLADALNQLNA